MLNISCAQLGTECEVTVSLHVVRIRRPSKMIAQMLRDSSVHAIEHSVRSEAVIQSCSAERLFSVFLLPSVSKWLPS